jgi:hypothetical protein
LDKCRHGQFPHSCDFCRAESGPRDSVDKPIPPRWRVPKPKKSDSAPTCSLCGIQRVSWEKIYEHLHTDHPNVAATPNLSDEDKEVRQEVLESLLKPSATEVPHGEAATRNASSREWSSRHHFQGMSAREMDYERQRALKKSGGRFPWVLALLVIGGIGAIMAGVALLGNLPDNLPVLAQTEEPTPPVMHPDNTPVPALTPTVFSPEEPPMETQFPGVLEPPQLEFGPITRPEQLFELYDSRKITLEEFRYLQERLSVNTAVDSSDLLEFGKTTQQTPRILFKGETQGTLIQESKDILERVWVKEGRGNLTITYTHIPIYDPKEDKFHLIDWKEEDRRNVTIVVPKEPTELAAGTVYATSFMALTLTVSDQPNSVPLEELQKIYAYSTEKEAAEIRKCHSELNLIYCTLFVAGSPVPTPPAMSSPSISAPIPLPRSIPTPTPTATPRTLERGSKEWIENLETEIHRLVNSERQKAGLKALSYDTRLAQIARNHSLDMARNDYFAHDNLSGQDPTARARLAGYDCRKDFGTYYVVGVAENLFQ